VLSTCTRSCCRIDRSTGQAAGDRVRDQGAARTGFTVVKPKTRRRTEAPHVISRACSTDRPGPHRRRGLRGVRAIWRGAPATRSTASRSTATRKGPRRRSQPGQRISRRRRGRLPATSWRTRSTGHAGRLADASFKNVKSWSTAANRDGTRAVRRYMLQGMRRLPSTRTLQGELRAKFSSAKALKKALPDPGTRDVHRRGGASAQCPGAGAVPKVFRRPLPRPSPEALRPAGIWRPGAGRPQLLGTPYVWEGSATAHRLLA